MLVMKSIQSIKLHVRSFFIKGYKDQMDQILESNLHLETKECREIYHREVQCMLDEGHNLYLKLFE